jgi:hypothetical protein
MLTLGTTTMQNAFVASKSVTMKSPLGQMILQTAAKQLEEADKAIQQEQAIQAATKKAIAALRRGNGESVSGFLLRISETKTRIRQEMSK